MDEQDFNEGRTRDRQWAIPLATNGQLHDRLWAGSHGRRQIGMTGPEELTVLKSDLDSITPAVDRAIAFSRPPRQSMSESDIESVVRALAPTAVIGVDLADQADEVHRKQFELTQQQQAVLGSISNWPRAWVKGAAGTGKTVLAITRARQLSLTGKRTMLVCFNQALGDHLVSEVDDTSIEAGHFHRLARKIGGPRQSGTSHETWLRAGCADQLLVAATTGDNAFDAIIIDEAQDFDPYWIGALESLLRPEGVLIAFADEHQQLFRRELVDLPELPIELTINCRNTVEIADRAARPLDIRWDHRLCATGPHPELHVVDGPPDRKIRSVVHTIISDGNLAPERVAILSTSRALVERLHDGKIGRWQPVPAGQVGLLCDTVHRFKGLEADAIVLVLDDEHASAIEVYVGMSRARTSLTVIASATSAEAIHWPVIST